MYGMYPQCKCYDSGIEHVRERCTSSCPDRRRPRAVVEAARVVSGVDAAMRERAGGAVNLAVFYSTMCPACRDFIQKGLGALAQVNLPGSAASVAVLPMNSDNPKA